MNNKFIIYMKAGPYCGYSLQQIEDIKNNEDRLYQKFYWGYGGVFCHPSRVQEFVKLCQENNQEPYVYFSITKSSFDSPIPQCKLQSLDKENWEPLPSEVILVGNQYSLVCTNLQKTNFEINMYDYQSTLGRTPGKKLAEFIRYRIDKSTALLNPDLGNNNKPITISYVSKLVPPYCVYVK